MRIFLKSCKEFDVDIDDFYRYLMRRYRSEILELELSVIALAIIPCSFDNSLTIPALVSALSALGFLQLVKRRVCRNINASSEEIIEYFKSRRTFDGIIIRLETYLKLINRIKG